MVFGENQKYAAALIVPEFINLKLWCEEKGFKFENREEMLNDSEIKLLFKNEINFLNSSLGDFERIMQYEILDKDWSIETGELSATLKVRRSFIKVKYIKEMKKIFADI